MLRLSKLADYSIILLTYLAQHAESVFAATDIATNTHIKPPTVSKILKQLTRSGLLQSVRGKQGGYQLAKAAIDINLAEVVEIMENHQAIVACADGSGCDLEAYCAVQGNWRIINQTIFKALASISIADLAKPISVNFVKQQVS